MVLRIYTDGSQIKRGKDVRTGYAFVIPHWNIQVGRGLIGPGETNNRAELTAIAHALEEVYRNIVADSIKAIDAKELVLYTDSQYALQVMKKWTKDAGVSFSLESQSTKDKWAHLRVVCKTTKDNTNVCDTTRIDAPNPDCIGRIYQAINPLVSADITIHFCKVEAHTGRTDETSRGNALADELAQQAALSGLPCKSQMSSIAKPVKPVILFGKFKGKTFDELEPSYIDWVAREFKKSPDWTKTHGIAENIRELISWKTKQQF